MDFFSKSIKTENQQVNLHILKEKNVELWIKREDKIHEFVSGNKFRKLKYNMIEANRQAKKVVLTFGGAYSNHIVATAVASNLLGLKSIGVIRGDELKTNINKLLLENETLRVASENKMQFHFISREHYRKKNENDFINNLYKKFGDFYLVPEGGTNEFAIKGCEEILTKEDEKFNYICTAVGTGGTIAGLINSSKRNQKIIGFPALKANFLHQEIQKIIRVDNCFMLQKDYHFGGYAKYNEELIRFINDFKRKTSILLDPIYTGKMLFGILDLVKKNYFAEHTKILAIHTGGLQGIAGINTKLKEKKIQEINTL